MTQRAHKSIPTRCPSGFASSRFNPTEKWPVTGRGEGARGERSVHLPSPSRTWPLGNHEARLRRGPQPRYGNH